MFFEEGQSAFITTHDKTRFCTTEHNDTVIEDFGFAPRIAPELHCPGFPYPDTEKNDHECNWCKDLMPWLGCFCHGEYCTHLVYKIQRKIFMWIFFNLSYTACMSDACRPLQKNISDLGTRSRLRTACAFAHEYLSDRKRRTGENYAAHGCEVGGVLSELTQDASLLSIAILHDLLVHPKGEEFLAQSPLNEEERSLVKSMHELRRLHIDADTHDLDRVLDAFVHEPRMMFLRMAHRVNDIRHLRRFDHVIQKQIARETLHMYTAIAGRLGFQKWRYEMEDACFLHLYPRTANHLQKSFAAAAKLDHASLSHTQKYLEKLLKQNDITGTLDGRIKGLYSTYRKMVVKRRTFGELTDRLALRIVVPTRGDCYRALGVVHARMHPIPGKLKDYIGAPKENGYRSIHTVVYPLPGVTEQPIEIQIRTEEMHRECEEGSLDHGSYKDWKYALRSPSARVNLFRNLESLRTEARSPKEFEAALRTYFREDHLIIFDEKNRLYHLKKPASVLDFACMAAGKRFGALKIARVNGRITSFDALLHDGDIVDLSFGRSFLIKPDWVHACRHASARQTIRTVTQKAGA